MITQKQKKYSYVLRVCRSDMTSYMGFKWPEKGPVEAPDWDPKPECGNGLHGFLNGEGRYTCSGYDISDPNLKWLVVKVLTKDLIDLGSKVKFPKGEVVFCGSREEIGSFLSKKIGTEFPILGGISTVGNKRNAIVGDFGQAMSGYAGSSKAGAFGTATTRDCGTSIVGDYGTATTGNCGTAIASNKGKACAGNYGTAIAKFQGTATVGKYGTATAGYGGTAMAGSGGIAVAKESGKASAGIEGILQLSYYDGLRQRVVIGYIGEDGILPNVFYKLDDNHKFVKAD